MRNEHPKFPGFVAVSIPAAEWWARVYSPRCCPYDGEKLLWSDGSAHVIPEDSTAAQVTVLRRAELVRRG